MLTILRQVFPHLTHKVLPLRQVELCFSEFDICCHWDVDFAFETTLATKSYVSLLKEAQLKGYNVVLAFFWLPSFAMAIERVKQRVIEGGHSIPSEVIKRRYQRGLENLFRLFMAVCDQWLLIDNSDLTPELIANGEKNGSIEVVNKQIWQQIIHKVSSNE